MAEDKQEEAHESIHKDDEKHDEDEKPKIVSKNLLKTNELIRNRWKILQKLGGGGYGQIYRAYDKEIKTEVAIKVEQGNCRKKVLRMEVAVLRQLQGQEHIAEFHGCGKIKHEDTKAVRFEYLVMELLYRNIADMRRSSPTEKLSKSTSLRVGMQALEAIRDIHKEGFVHRDKIRVFRRRNAEDIKPSNFAMGYDGERIRTVILIDFGLCRKHLDDRGKVRRMRKNVGFRGTIRYASPRTHKHKDLGRGDDLYSLFYMIVEMCIGHLPWRNIKDRNEVLKLKQKSKKQLCENLPKQILRFHRIVLRISYDAEPNYQVLMKLLESGLKSVGGRMDDPFDWEVDYDTAVKG